MIMLVREIGLNWLHSDIGDSFGTGLILASLFVLVQGAGAPCHARALGENITPRNTLQSKILNFLKFQLFKKNYL